MITEEQRYRAYTLNVAGFALMTPLGKVFLEYIQLFRDLGLVLFIVNFVVSFLLFSTGLTFVDHGRSILDEKRRTTGATRSS